MVLMPVQPLVHSPSLIFWLCKRKDEFWQWPQSMGTSRIWPFFMQAEKMLFMAGFIEKKHSWQWHHFSSKSKSMAEWSRTQKSCVRNNCNCPIALKWTMKRQKLLVMSIFLCFCVRIIYRFEFMLSCESIGDWILWALKQFEFKFPTH